MVKGTNDKHSDESLVIFYADDDEDDLDTFKDVINDLNGNTSIYTHENGDKLLDALKNPPPFPNLVFLDLNMPGKNGFEILTEIRKSANLKETPVIIVSTSSDHNTIIKTRSLGANYYIPKANNYSTFKKSIDYALSIDWDEFKPDTDDFVYKNN